MDRWLSISFLRRSASYRAALLFGGLLALPVHADALPPDCGDLPNHYGPYDYTNPSHFQDKLPVVEQYHFSREQELSTFKPNSKQSVDFDYTLRAFPNHHRALMALVRWLKNHEREAWPGKMRAECYFHRALAWRPRDSVARMIFGLYLHQNKRVEEAEYQYQTAIKVQPGYAEAHYNLGLLYAEQKRWPQALAEAHKAYELNYPLPGLKKRLTDAKQWREPAPIEVPPELHAPIDQIPYAPPPAPADNIDAGRTEGGNAEPSTVPTPTSDQPTPGIPQ